MRFGAEGARAAVAGRRGEVGLELEVTVRRGEGKRARLNGAPLRAAEQLRSLVSTLVFTPDRLGVVKGPPAARRAYFDRVLGRFAPARAPLPTEYGAAVAQRNAALRRAAAGVSGRDAVEPWSERVATLGAELVAARLEALTLLGPPFAARADEFGLGEVALRYDGEPPTPEGLAAVLDRDLERGVTSLGPHLDDVVIAAANRDLRSFGSQGEQRLALLALLLAEAETIADRTGVPAAPPARRRPLGARSRPPRDPRGPRAQRRAGARHRDRRGDAARRARPAARGDAGHRAGGGRLMEPLGDQIRAELSRVGADSGAGDAVTAWPAAVGEEIARNAWPARTQPDGTLVVHVRDAIWGFELTQRAAEISERLPGRPRLRFTPGTAAGDDSRAASCAAGRGVSGAGAGGRRPHRRNCGSKPA